MDEANTKVFKLKFMRLTVILNVIVMLAALSIIAFFGIIPVYSMPIAVVCAIGTVVLLVYFMGAYKKDKKWLADNE
ncbi:MAG: hypothetical protein JRC90_11325 [Deltaproteobacteria bacterium]|nr:hypothetical protein [Deltaproteobacteria bacterium]